MKTRTVRSALARLSVRATFTARLDSLTVVPCPAAEDTAGQHRVFGWP